VLKVQLELKLELRSNLTTGNSTTNTTRNEDQDANPEQTRTGQADAEPAELLDASQSQNGLFDRLAGYGRSLTKFRLARSGQTDRANCRQLQPCPA
jgi:hypothetical protein